MRREKSNLINSVGVCFITYFAFRIYDDCVKCIFISFYSVC